MSENDSRGTRAAIFVDDRIAGCLLGGAVGDALGGAVEFMSLSQIRAMHGALGISELAEAYGRIGAITDDTQMTLFTAEGLLRGLVRHDEKGICHPPSVVHHAYLRWLETQGIASRAAAGLASPGRPWPDGWLIEQRELWHQRAPGRTCIAALQAAARLGELADNDSKGCGAVMRVAPVGILCAARADGTTAFTLGCDVSRLTHGHASGYLAGGYFALLIAMLLEGEELGSAVLEAREPLHGVDADASEVLAAIEGAVRLARADGEPTAERVETLGAGWVAEEALAIALYCALVARDFEHGVRLAVNHSGDSDSTGSMAGNLLGVMHGMGPVPLRWLAQLELREVITTMANDLAGARAGKKGLTWERYPGW